MSAKHDDSVTSDDNEPSLVHAMDREALLASVEPEAVKTVVKLLLGMGGLVFLLLLVSFLPGLDRLVPATPITFAGLVIALVTLGIVAVLVYVAPQLETLVQQGFTGDDALATNVAAVVKHLVILLAVLVAYRGLAGAIVPFLAETDSIWADDLSFLVLALIPTALIAIHLYRGLDPAADLLTSKVTTTAAPTVPVEEESESDTAGQETTTDESSASEDKTVSSGDEAAEVDTVSDEQSGDAADSDDSTK